MSVWGFADLHTHPASHLAFGAVNTLDDAAYGTGGIFWGKPGLALADAPVSIATDLPPCPTDKHAGFDEDLIRHQTRLTVIQQVNGLTQLPHGAGGYPAFSGWPHAQSVLHQQMHVSWIHRAYQGGLRLMFASVTDNQTLSMLWHRSRGAPRPQPDPNSDYHSAEQQLKFIQRLVAANSAWMEIVTSPAQARSVIGNNKLAVILSLEMDSLSIEQIVSLKERYGVRHVIPIHLIDNGFGAVAVYSDLFNSHNCFVNGRFYKVAGDSTLEFQLSKPQYLKYITADPFGGGDLFKHGAVEPTPISDADYGVLGYPTTQGHRNALGLDKTKMLELMGQDLLIDLAHMSDASQSDALDVAEQYGYPLMNSHTGLRPDDGASRHERSMRRSLAGRMARLGGMLGLGTEGNPNGDPVRNWSKNTWTP